MRRTMLFGVICLMAAALMAGDKLVPMNVKTGLWQNTSTTSVNGALGVPPELMAQMTPEQRARYEAAMKSMGNNGPKARVTKGCLTEKDRHEDPFARMSEDGKMKCQETVLRSTETDLEVRESCTEGTSKGDAHMTFHAMDSEHVTGTAEVTATMGGGTMHSNTKMDFKWLGPSCPKNLEH